jgi:hypothetical protein
MKQAEANEFVREFHRRHGAVRGAKFCLTASTYVKIIGVAIVGRPVARMLDDCWTLEVNRTCTDGTKNVSSLLYGACRRAIFALGYRRLLTYTLGSEQGAQPNRFRVAALESLAVATGRAPTFRPASDITKAPPGSGPAVPQKEGK